MEFEKYASNMDVVNKQKSEEKESLHISCVNNCFQLHIMHAMNILIQHVGGSVKPKQKEQFHRTAHYMSRLLKPYHQNIYEDLFTRTSKALCDTYIKLKNTSTLIISKDMIDLDFLNIYRILETLCQRGWYIPILLEFTNGFNPADFIFEIDLVFHRITTQHRK